MGFRVFQLLTLVFWLGSLVWLGLTVWAPEGSRMREVDPREAIDAFFAWNETTNLTLLENGIRRGQVAISGGSGDDEETGLFLNSLSVSGTIESRDSVPGETLVDLFWRGVVQFRRDLALHDGDFSVRIPGRRLTAHLTIEGPEGPVVARALLDGVPLFEFDSGKNDAATALANASRLPIPGVAETLTAEAASALTFDIRVRRGVHRIAGRDLRAFFVILAFPDYGQEIRAYLSEAGEPLRVETDLGFEAVSEMLVPLDAYQ